MLELRTPLPVVVIESPRWRGPTGHGLAIFVDGEHPELNLVWTIIMQATGEFWCVPNQFVRAEKNITGGR